MNSSSPRVVSGGFNVSDPGLPEKKRRWEGFVQRVEKTWGPGNFSTLFRYLHKKGDVLSGEFVAYLRREGLGEMAEELEAKRREGVESLARGLARSRWLHDRTLLRSRLAEREETSGVTVEDQKWHLAQEGFLLAVDDLSRPQSIRIGEKWVTDEKGKKAHLAPATLVWGKLERWLANATLKAAEAGVMDAPWPRSKTKDPKCFWLLNDVLSLKDETPLDRLVREEDLRGLEKRIEKARLTPAQAEYLDAFFSAGDWPEPRGVNPGTMRKRKKSLLDRLRPT
jgi:hypothetical protein